MIMERKVLLALIFDYLEFSYDEFQEYLEEIKEVEGSEAELILKGLEKVMGER